MVMDPVDRDERERAHREGLEQSREAWIDGLVADDDHLLAMFRDDDIADHMLYSNDELTRTTAEFLHYLAHMPAFIPGMADFVGEAQRLTGSVFRAVVEGEMIHDVEAVVFAARTETHHYDPATRALFDAFRKIVCDELRKMDSLDDKAEEYASKLEGGHE